MKGIMRYRMIICVLVLNFICRICQCQKTACTSKLRYGWYETNCTMSNSSYIYVRHFRFGAEIKCYGDDNWTALPHLLNSPAVSPSAYLLKILHCNLPNEPIKEIGSKVGVKNITSLTLFLVKKTTIQITHFHDLSNLRQLTLRNAIVMKSDILESVSKLNALHIHDSFIPSLFENIKDMKMLNSFLVNNVTLNFSTDSPHQYLNNQMQLTDIVMRNNHLSDFTWNPFRDLISVTRFIIENSNIRNLSQDFFENYQNLRSISLSGNGFTTLPKNLLANNKNLTTVHISNNSRKLKLPSGFFGNLPKLEELYTACSNLAEVPEDLIWGSRSLKFLNFYTNRLTTLPQGIFRDSEMLRRLILNSNQISQLPDGLFLTAFNLKRLELSDNNLTEITEFMFIGLRELHELFLERNKLEHIHMNAFSSLLNVQFIQLSYNRLLFNYATPSSFTASHEAMSPFDKLTSLSVLNLSHNQIQKFVRSRKVSPSRYLDLSYNNISTLSVMDLFYQSSNVTVDLSHNAIHHIDFERVNIYAAVAHKDKILTDSRNVKILLDNNPLHCDCQVYDFIKHLKAGVYSNVERIFHIVPGNMSCASPYWMEGQSVTNIDLNHLICMSSLCPKNCICWKAAHDKTYTINCADRKLTKIPDISKFPEENNIILNLTGNLFTETPLMNHSQFVNVTRLLLSNNNISVFHEETISGRLQVLEMHNNNMTTINERVLNAIKNSSSLTSITLHGNPWKCGCDAKEFANFIVVELKNFIELSEVKCPSGAIIAEMTVHQLCPSITATIIISCLVVTLSAFILATTAALYYRHQKAVKVWLYNHQLCLTFVTEEEIDKHKQYDAFISYSHKDEDFVVKELLKKLEQGPIAYKICVHFRDWIVGDWIPDQIVRSVKESRRTLIVMSANFLESVWGRLELRTAHNQALNDTTARVIIIIYGDIGSIDDLDFELKTYISTNTYVKWGDPWFWEKLRYALPHSVRKHRHLEKYIKTTY